VARSIEITVLKVGLFGFEARVCCNLSPIQVFFRHRKVERVLTSVITTYGFLCWRVYLGRDKRYRPMRCEGRKGRWHYIVYS